MLLKLLSTSMISFLILEIINPLEIQAEHKNSLINRFCLASIKSKLNFKDKEKLEEISHFTCECFLTKYKSASSIKNARDYCKNEAIEKYNLE